MSCWKYGHPRPSLATFPYRSLPQAGLLDNMLYPHIVAECMFVLVVLLLHGHVWGSIRVYHLLCSSLLLQQCPSCLVRLTWIVFVIGGRWPYSLCLVGCCRQDLFKIARSILVQLPSSFFSSRFVRVHVVHPYSSIDATAAWKKLRCILSVRSDRHIIDSLLFKIFPINT